MIIGASFDTVEEQRAFAETEGFGYVLISDADKSIGRRYHAEREPGRTTTTGACPVASAT